MMEIPRVIPILLYRNGGLVKSMNFKNYRYIGDPINTVKIFNEKEVDELFLLDIGATEKNRKPDLGLIENIASECFMPLGYGGGVSNLSDIKEIFKLGVEKVSINSAAVSDPDLIKRAADLFGSQSIVVSLDVKKGVFGKYEIYTHGGRRGTGFAPVGFALKMEEMGAGEILLNSIDRDGTMKGYDIELLRKVAAAVHIPVIACGGAGRVQDLGEAIKKGGTSAVAAGSMFVYHGKHRAVLINYPTPQELERCFAQNELEVISA